MDFLFTEGEVRNTPRNIALIAGREADFVYDDRSYKTIQFIQEIEALGVIPVILTHKNGMESRPFFPHLQQELHLVKCFVNKTKYHRCIFSRFDKLARRHLGILPIAVALLWLLAGLEMSTEPNVDHQESAVALFPQQQFQEST